jgi:5-methylcytosine-specific restriction protein A
MELRSNSCIIICYNAIVPYWDTGSLCCERSPPSSEYRCDGLDLPFHSGILYGGSYMPRRAPTPCCYPGCGKLTDGRYCAEHTRKANHDYNQYVREPDSNKRYGAEWRRIRSAYISINPLCEDCKTNGRYVPAEEVHHIKPIAEGGSNDWQNLRSLCKSCHSRISSGNGWGHGRKLEFYGSGIKH